MPHQIFEIDELLELVIDELVEIGQGSAVSFALTCRSLEEPTLGSLWKKQSSLIHLVKVLPNCTWVKNKHGHKFITIEHDPSAEDWTRLQRYATWMRGLRLSLDGTPTTETLLRLSCNSPGGLLFPKLEWLHWDVYKAGTPPTFFRLFLSPNLQRVTLYTEPHMSGTPQDQVAALIQMISSLPTSLESLLVMCGRGREALLQDAMSSIVRRCGPSLRSFGTWVPLSEPAIHHLMQLPNLSYWRTVQGPPRVPASVFPSLEQLRLDDQEALQWLHLLASHEKDVLRSGSASMIPHTNIRETLKSLDCPKGTVLDSSFVSSVVKFQNLVTLHVHTYYCVGVDGCFFRMTDEDVKDIAAALPRLDSLRFGEPCGSNTCDTTVASLMSISTHCPDLTVLETHFYTKTLASDMRRLLEGSVGRDEAKCKLRSLLVGTLPLEVRGEDIETIAMGLKAIFPHLTNLTGHGAGWRVVRFRLME